MFANIRQDYYYLNHVSSDPGSRALARGNTSLPVTSLTFDSREELLWMGNSGGHVTSYYGLGLQKYTSFQVVPDTGPVGSVSTDIRAQLTGDYGLLSLSSNALRMSMRRGLTIFDHKSDLFKDMYCMSHLDNSDLILMGGQQGQLIEFELNRRKEVRVTEISDDANGCVIIRNHPKLVCCGDSSGKITLRDKSNLKVCHSFQSHSGQLSDFDVRGNQLVTCGYSKNGYSDRFLMVYDLRMLKAVNPIQLTFAPFMLRFVPIYTSKFALVSRTGQFQLLDANGSSVPTPPFIHTIDIPHGSSISAIDVSNSSQSLSFADDSGFIYLFGASNEVSFNKNSQETEFPDEVSNQLILFTNQYLLIVFVKVERPPSIPITDTTTPFSTVLPAVIPTSSDTDAFCKSLLSHWPVEYMKKNGYW